MLDNLYRIIIKTVELSEKDKGLCGNYFEEIYAKRNTVLEIQDKKPQYLYFISKGFMRLFYYDDNGDEVTTNLASPDGFLCSFLSFIHEKPSPENLESITDTELLRISRTNLVALIDQSENFKKFSVTIFEQAIASSQIRANDLATLTADLRYKKFINDYPGLIQNVPLLYIASFLGIKPQSLSRIRNQQNK